MTIDELRGAKAQVEAGLLPVPEDTVYVNNHIHTTYSFSPYSPTDAVYMAWKNGLKTAGIMDHDSVAGAREFLEAAAAKFKKQFPNWKVSLQVPDEFLMIPMDAVLIEQVLFNLMENAVNHAIGADQIWVSLERYSEDGIFAVRDNGCGIDPALLPGIFDGKTSTPESMGDRKRNMGIGLSVCHTIIRAHGGSMKAENEKTGGAVFSFTLPLEEGVYE